ncbi:MAG: hypothetical protein GY820_27300 [Gammaproteobacteria bacterium]|nr:hypothetical protein [Gammaproteobacteria bacterium]
MDKQHHIPYKPMGDYGVDRGKNPQRVLNLAREETIFHLVMAKWKISDARSRYYLAHGGRYFGCCR